MATLRPGSRLHPDVEAAIREMGLEGLSPAQIERRLHDDKRLASHAPDRRTIQRAARFYRLDDRSDPWALATANPEDAAFVMDAIAAVRAETGARPRVTVALAEWIVRVRRARPDLVPAPAPDGSPAPTWKSRVVSAYSFARRYLWHASSGQPTERLDEELATFARVERVRVDRTVPPGSRIVGGKRDRAAERRMSESMQRGAEALKEEDDGTTG